MSEDTLARKVSKKTLILAAIGILVGVVFSAYLSSSYSNSTATKDTRSSAYKQTLITEESFQKENSNVEVKKAEELPTVNSVETITTIEVGPKDEQPKTKQNIENSSTQVTVTPKPTAPKTVKSGSTETIQQATSYCPDSRSENPAVYDACREGFTAPTSFAWAGYHSCKRISDTEVEIYGLVKMSGGNYKDVTYGQPTQNGLILVSSTNTSSPYFVSWDIEAAFWSMDSRYSGRIAQAGDSGSKLIQESDLAASCRL